MRFFIAGIMQGSHLGTVLHNQNYRERVKELLYKHFPGCDVYDPLADHGQSLDYDDVKAREVFLEHNRMCASADVVVAFVPEATMGTAIEMWEAHKNGRVVITISPLLHNWVVKYCSCEVYADLDIFQTALETGQVAKSIEKHKHSADIASAET